jgi:hypothetical protein
MWHWMFEGEGSSVLEATMLAPEALQRLQRYNFDLLAREEPIGRRRLRYIALTHLKDG